MVTPTRSSTSEPLGYQGVAKGSPNPRAIHSALRRGADYTHSSLTAAAAIRHTCSELAIDSSSPSIQLQLPNCFGQVGEYPRFILGLYDKSILKHVFHLRKHPLDDELCLLRMPSTARQTNSRLHMMTTRMYDRLRKMAAFCLRRDLMDELAYAPVDSQLRLAMWRTDDYMRQRSSQKIAQIHDNGIWIRGQDKLMPEPNAAEDDGDDGSDWSDLDSEEDSRLEQRRAWRRDGELRVMWRASDIPHHFCTHLSKLLGCTYM